MKTPFVKVYLKNRELSPYIESVKFDRSDEKDDYVNIRLWNVADDEDIVVGAVVKFQYGFLGGIPSPMHSCIIAEIKLDYKFNANKVAIELKCLDKGSIIKQANSEKVWKGKCDDIVREIASKYSMEVDLQSDHDYKTYKSLPQGFKSDFQLLDYLARREGAFEVYVMANTLVFKMADMGKKAKRLFTYGVNIVSLTIELRAVHKNKNVHAVVSMGIDKGSKNLQTVMQTSTHKYEESLKFDHLKLKNFRQGHFTKEGVFGELDDIRSSPQKMNQAIKKEALYEKSQQALRDSLKKQIDAANFFNKSIDKNGINSPQNWVELKPFLKTTFGTDDLASFGMDSDGENGKFTRIYPVQKNQGAGGYDSGANNALSDSKKAQKKVLVGTLDIELDTSFEVGDIITLSGVAKRHSGNWYVVGVEDSISANRAAMTRLRLSRNSSNGKMTVESVKNDNVNDSVGKDGQGKNEKAIQFSQDGRAYNMKGEIDYKNATKLFDK